jgi:hypothetical protein
VQDQAVALLGVNDGVGLPSVHNSQFTRVLDKLALALADEHGAAQLGGKEEVIDRVAGDIFLVPMDGNGINPDVKQPQFSQWHFAAIEVFDGFVTDLSVHLNVGVFDCIL